MANLLRIYPENPSARLMEQVVETLKKGGVIIIPTDTIYSFAADINQPKALERMAQLKGKKIEESDFSFIFKDLSHISDYTMQFDTPVYKILKRSLPGPFTFIMNANKSVPKIFNNKKRTIGIRVPNNPLPRQLVEMLGNPIATTSIRSDDEIIEYNTDPELIFEKYKKEVDLVIHGGIGNNVASSVIDLTSGEPAVIREGQGDVNTIV